VDSDSHEHEPVLVSLEGPSITEGLDADRTSSALRAEKPFERLAVLYDAPDPTALELSTSADGVSWSEFAVPILTFSEEGAHVANLDLPAPAQFYRYRVRDMALAPTYVAFDAIEHMPLLELGEALDVDEEEEEMAAEAIELEDSFDGIGTTKSGLSTSIGNVTVHSRADWGARAPNCVSATTPFRVTIHHTVGPIKDSLSPQARLRQIQNFHMNSRGYCDIGYNFLVSRDGRVWRGRGSLRLGAHTLNNNTGNVGIAFIGTYTDTRITRTQKCRAARLLRWLAVHRPAIDLKRSDIKGHRQYGDTACPGNALYNQLDSLVSTARNGCD
jgi:hypothetical protein